MLTLAMTQNWHIKQIDYILAYTQAVAETDMYMDAPKRFTFKDANGKCIQGLCSSNQKELLLTKTRGTGVESAPCVQSTGSWFYSKYP